MYCVCRSTTEDAKELCQNEMLLSLLILLVAPVISFSLSPSLHYLFVCRFAPSPPGAYRTALFRERLWLSLSLRLSERTLQTRSAVTDRVHRASVPQIFSTQGILYLFIPGEAPSLKPVTRHLSATCHGQDICSRHTRTKVRLWVGF